MADDIFMDVNEVKKMAGRFTQMSEKMEQANKTLDAIINMLKISAMVGSAGSAMYAQYLEQLKPQIRNYAVQCGTMADDLKASAEAYERGDAAGAARFH